MPFPPEVETARAQVFQLIGRNVLRFQRIELVLKSMVTGSQISVTHGESPSAHERRVQTTHKSSMGLVAGDFFKDVVTDQPPIDDVPVSREEAKAAAAGKVHIGFSYKIYFPPEEHRLWKDRLQKLIEERNELVHTSLLRMDLETLTGCQKALAKLEEQATRVLAEIERLKPLCSGAVEARQKAIAVLSDDTFWETVRADNPAP